ncbi:MAG: dihydropteroate synthase [Methylophilaceae bacterium]|nr:dihydropteroate synthase [Methylophilaceae bacterium]|tara:strand:- start:8031 stop:8864 length:834 start_codon:yes stop_codon:yes gene_type:complete
MKLHCGQFTLDLTSPRVMGILNVTPDSFSDGGHYSQTDIAVKQAYKFIEEGADIIDIGGESTRPNAEPVSLQEELDRVIPVIESLASKIDIPISIDTYKPAVMRAAMAAGASIVNDVKALQEAGAIEAVANADVAVCLMHMQGEPRNMQDDPHYDDVVEDVVTFLLDRVAICEQAGIQKNRLLIDPGFGFGKTRMHNITLIQQLNTLVNTGYPVLVGLSRKSVLGQITGNDIDARLYVSVSAAVVSAINGAKILRVHDVKATVEALKVVTAILPNEA